MGRLSLVPVLRHAQNTKAFAPNANECPACSKTTICTACGSLQHADTFPENQVRNATSTARNRFCALHRLPYVYDMQPSQICQVLRMKCEAVSPGQRNDALL